MQHNRRRTGMTVLGMAWGIATVVLLLAYGSGFGRAITAIFSHFGIKIHRRLSRDEPSSRPADRRPACR